METQDDSIDIAHLQRVALGLVSISLVSLFDQSNTNHIG